MLFGYGNYGLTFAITGSAAGAAFLTDSAALGNGRSGDGTTMQWIGGAQSTASFVQINVTIADPLDATAAQGVVGLQNIQGLPVGTKVQLGSVVQRLVADARGQLNAWGMPFANSNSLAIKIFNDVNGVASIPASAVFAGGGIFCGRVLTLPTLVGSNNPSRTLIGIPADNRTGRNQNYALMRNAYWQVAAQLGIFTRTDAKGGLLSKIASGGNPAGVIDVQTFKMLLSQSPFFAICDSPCGPASTLSNGIRFDQAFMQTNWMGARMANVGQLAETSTPYWTWNPQFAEAT